RFRGTDWMPEPCRSCARRELDFGGCRCQAFLLTGDAARTDPVCHLSPDHGLVIEAVRAADEGRRSLRVAPVPRPHPERRSRPAPPSGPPGGRRRGPGQRFDPQPPTPVDRPRREGV
ncbi:MAG TPA: hypothetical protein VFD01_11900, partial [Candidatus Dormibacteraeota bacterium]|nr:hypothetical protein [Candidatus Dormibacteraeota bacterium]